MIGVTDNSPRRASRVGADVGVGPEVDASVPVGVGIEPLSARSIALSTLLGYHPPALPISALIRVGRLFDIADTTMRVALSRMVSAGDVRVVDGRYQLNDRLVQRQARQDATRSPVTKPWDGTWEIAVVTVPPRPLGDRTALRKAMTQLRLGELREGVWLRPDNLVQERSPIAAAQCTFFKGPCEETDLAERLWDLPTWAARAQELLAVLTAVGDLKAGFLASIEVISHLAMDPCLPPEMLPAGWPAADLRNSYLSFNAEFANHLKETVVHPR